MTRSRAWLAASAAILFADVEARASGCLLHLVGSNGSFDRYTTGACPQQDLAQAHFTFVDPVRQLDLDARAAGNLGSVAARAFWMGQEPMLAQGSQVTPADVSLDCTLSGPASPVLTRLAFEVAAEASVTRNGTDDYLTSSWLNAQAVLDGPEVLAELTSTFQLYGRGSPTTPYSCSGTGVFSSSACSGHVIVARQKVFTPQVSMPTGPVTIQLAANVQAYDPGVGDPWGVFNSSSAKLEVSLPSDGSSVLDLPDGFTLDCENGSVVDNVWEATPVGLPAPPAAVPALSRAGLSALIVSILSVTVVARRRKRGA